MTPFLDWHFIACITALWTMAVCAIAYLIGRNHGWTDGYYHALDKARGEWIPRLIKAKRDGAHVGRLIELHRQTDLLTRENRDLRGQVQGSFEGVEKN